MPGQGRKPKRAYVEARYSDQCDVSPKDLDAITASARQLRDRVAASCEGRLQALRTALQGN